MRWRKAAHVALTSALTFQTTSAKLITITEYPTSCKAIYTSGSRSVTIVRSTLAVSPSPSPWSDDDANDGAPFVLEVRGSDGQQKRQAGVRSLVRSDGTITTSIEDAAQFMIDENGGLTSVDGGYVSTNGDTRHEIFALSPTKQSISTEFSVEGGILSWANSAFTDGSAQFFQIEVSGNKNADWVLVRFSGRINPNWIPISLVARPADERSQGGSTTAINSSSGHSTRTHREGGAINSSGGEHESHIRSRTRTRKQPSTASTLSTAASATASGKVSPDGTCGGESGYTCIGSGWGDCCSRRGQCGADRRFCNNGCQPLYGICLSSPSSASSARSSIVSWPVTISVSIPSVLTGNTISETWSTSLPTSIFTSTAGPIGTIDNSVFTSRATSTSGLPPQNPSPSIGGSSSVEASASATTSTLPSFAPCSTSEASLCATPDNSATCSSPGGTPYNNSCGVVYRGPVIDTSNINGLPPARGVAFQGAVIDTSDVVGLQKRATEASLTDCQTLCDRFPTCVALNYIGNNCTLLSGIEGTDYLQGAIGGAVPPAYVPAKTNPPSSAAPAPPAGSSAAAASNPGFVQPSSSPGMIMSASTPPSISASSAPAAVASSSNTEIVGITASSPVMFMSTISEIVTSSTALAPFQAVSSASAEEVTSSPTSAGNDVAPTSNTPASGAASASSSSAAPSTSSGSASCPSANGTSYYDQTGLRYIVLCDVGFTSEAVDGSARPSFEACVESCASLTTAECVGVTFTPSARSGLGSCSYYSDYSGTFAQPGVSGAVLASVLLTNPVPAVPSSSASQPTTSSEASSTISSTVIPPSSAVPSSSPAVTSTPTSSSARVSSSAIASSTFSIPSYLVLPSPTPCDFGDYADDGTPLDEDDNTCEIQLPFTMRMYDQRDTWTYASINGYISLESGSAQYGNHPFPASNIPANSVAPFFDDLYIVGNSSPQSGIFYQIDGGAITYEYFLNRGANNGGGDPSEIFHFTVHYDSAQPGIFTYTYYQTGGPSDNGLYAAVGIQGVDSSGAEKGFTYSYQSASITPGLIVRCNTIANTCITVQR